MTIPSRGIGTLRAGATAACILLAGAVATGEDPWFDDFEPTGLGIVDGLWATGDGHWTAQTGFYMAYSDDDGATWSRLWDSVDPSWRPADPRANWLVRRPDGSLLLVFNRRSDLGADPWYNPHWAMSVSTDNGASWSRPRRVGDRNTSRQSVASEIRSMALLDVGRGAYELNWLSHNNSTPVFPLLDADVRRVVHRSRDSGTTWDKVVPFEAGDPAFARPQHSSTSRASLHFTGADGDGRIVAFERVAVGTASDLRVRVSRDFGASWEPIDPLTTTDFPGMAVSAIGIPILSDDAPWIIPVWLRDTATNEAHLATFASRDFGRSWVAMDPAPLGHIGNLSSARFQRARNGELAYFQTTHVPLRAYFSPDGGATWESAGPLLDPGIGLPTSFALDQRQDGSWLAMGTLPDIGNAVATAPGRDGVRAALAIDGGTRRNSPLAGFAATFDQPVVGLEPGDFLVHRDGAVLEGVSLQIMADGPGAYTIAIDPPLAADGAYFIELVASGSSIAAEGGGPPLRANAAASVEILTSPHTAALAEAHRAGLHLAPVIELAATRGLEDFDATAFTLRREGATIPLDADSFLIGGGRRDWRIDTAPIVAALGDGDYTLAVDGPASGIVDLHGNALSGEASISFRVDGWGFREELSEPRAVEYLQARSRLGMGVNADDEWLIVVAEPDLLDGGALALKSTNGGGDWTRFVAGPGLFPPFPANSDVAVIPHADGAWTVVASRPDQAPEAFRTPDGGQSWTAVPLPGMPPMSVPGDYEYMSPQIASDKGQRAAIIAVGDFDLPGGGTGRTYGVAFTDDAGMTWSEPALVAQSLGDGTRTMAIAHLGGNNWGVAYGGEPAFAPLRCYAFVRTDDEGATWSTPVPVGKTALQWIAPQVGMQPSLSYDAASGAIALARRQFTPFPNIVGNLQFGGAIFATISTDGGATWMDDDPEATWETGAVSLPYQGHFSAAPQVLAVSRSRILTLGSAATGFTVSGGFTGFAFNASSYDQGRSWPASNAFIPPPSEEPLDVRNIVIRQDRWTAMDRDSTGRVVAAWVGADLDLLRAGHPVPGPAALNIATIDIRPLRGMIAGIEPNPSPYPVLHADIEFSEEVVGVDIEAFQLLRDGAPASLAGEVLEQTGPRAYRLTLSSATVEPGFYTLVCLASSHGIGNLYGDPVLDDFHKDFRVEFGGRGDLDGDGVIDAADLRLLEDAILGRVKLAPGQLFHADLNDDGILDAADLVLMQEKAAD